MNKTLLIISLLLLTITSNAQKKKTLTKNFTIADLEYLIKTKDEGAIDNYLSNKDFYFRNNRNLDDVTTMDSSAMVNYLSTYTSKWNKRRLVTIAYQYDKKTYVEFISDNSADYINAYNYLKTHKYKFNKKSVDDAVTWLTYVNANFTVILGKGLMDDGTKFDISIRYNDLSKKP